MTSEEITELALQCGIWIPLASGPEREQTIDNLRRFVALVEAAERDALRAAVCHEADCVEACKSEIDALRAKIEAMERQEPSHWGCTVLQSDGRWKEEVSREAPPEGYFSIRDIFPLYTLPGAQAQPAPAQSTKDDIISDLQSQFDTEGITEYASDDALIRLSDAIAAVEDNFALAQPAPSVPEGFSREDLEAVAAGLDGYEKTVNVGNVTGEGDDHLESTTAYAARFIRTMLAAALEAKPCGAQIGASVPVAALRPVIDWLRNGCDPMKAADELDLLIAAAPEIKP